MSKINSAESVRGLACLAVVFSHLSLTFYPYLHRDNQSGLPNYDFLYYLHHSPFAFIYAGHAAVYVFFVLSGFVLAYATLNKKENAQKKILSMTIKRYPRLAIPAICSVLIYWLVFHFEMNTSNASVWSANIGSYMGSIFDALFDGSIRAFAFGKSNYNWVLWTMQTEFIGSLVVFIFAYFYLKNRAIAIFWLPISIVASAFFISLGFSFGIACFAIGVLFYLYGRKINFITGLIMLFIGLYLAGIHNTSFSYQWIHNILGDKSYNLISIVSAPLIVYSILMNEKISEILDRKFLVFLGKLSFSIYLLHFLVIYIIALPLYNFLLPNLDFLMSSIIACISTIIVTFLISIPFSNNVDDLSIKVGKKIENTVMR